MSNSKFRKHPKHQAITRKMLMEKMQEMSNLLVVMEATLMEWEVWFKLFPQMKKNMTQEQFVHYVCDGPVFTEFPEKIMKSVRENMPLFADPEPEENKPAILDGSGNVANDKKLLLDPSGKPIV